MSLGLQVEQVSPKLSELPGTWTVAKKPRRKTQRKPSPSFGGGGGSRSPRSAGGSRSAKPVGHIAFSGNYDAESHENLAAQAYADGRARAIAMYEYGGARKPAPPIGDYARNYWAGFFQKADEILAEYRVDVAAKWRVCRLPDVLI